MSEMGSHCCVCAQFVVPSRSFFGLCLSVPCGWMMFASIMCVLSLFVRMNYDNTTGRCVTNYCGLVNVVLYLTVVKFNFKFRSSQICCLCNSHKKSRCKFLFVNVSGGD